MKNFLLESFEEWISKRNLNEAKKPNAVTDVSMLVDEILSLKKSDVKHKGYEWPLETLQRYLQQKITKISKLQTIPQLLDFFVKDFQPRYAYYLIKFKPEFKEYMQYQKLDAKDWESILTFFPEDINVAKKYNGIEKLQTKRKSGGNLTYSIGEVLKEQPQLKDYFDLSTMSNLEWRNLLIKHWDIFKHEITEEIWDKFENSDWHAFLTSKHLNKNDFMKYVKWKTLNKYQWYWILKSDPSLADKAEKEGGFDKMSGDLFDDLYTKHPELLKYKK